MGKRILRAVAALSLLTAAVFYLLSELMPEKFGAFNLAWAGVILAGANAAAFLINALFERNPVLKKINIFAAAGLAVLCVLCLAFAIALPKNLVLPVIAVVLSAALVLGVLFTGAKKWDAGDNQKAGYKTYRERKKEEEKGEEQENDGEEK